MRALALATFLALLSINPGFTQTQDYWFGFPIKDVQKVGQTHLVTVEHGLSMGIKPQMEGEVWRKGSQSKSIILGKLKVTHVTENQTQAEVSGDEMVQPGDVLFVQLPSKMMEHTPYFYLVMYGITIEDDSGRAFYTPEELQKNDGVALRSQKFLEMQKAIHASAILWKDREITVEAGPLMGKKVYDALVATDTIRIWTYLYDLAQDWEWNVGKRIKLTESFADYTKVGDAHSPAMLKSLLQSSKDLPKSYSDYQRVLTTEMVNSWLLDVKQLRKESKFEEAISLIKVCRFIIDQKGSPYDQARYLFEEAAAYHDAQQMDEAVIRYQQSAIQFEKLNQEAAAAYPWYNQALILDHQHKWAEAGASFKKALRYRQNAVANNPEDEDDLELLLETNLKVAEFFRETDQTSEALSYYKQGIETAEKSLLEVNAGDFYWSRGFLYSEKLKNAALAVQDYQKAYDLYEGIDTSSMITLKRNIAINQDKLKQYTSAKASIGEAVQLARIWKDKTTLAYALDYQGLSAYERKDYEQSIESYSESEKIYQQLNDLKRVISTKKNIANILRDMKKSSLALAKHQERLKLTEKTDAATQADILWDMAFIYGIERKTIKKSEEFYLEAIKHYQSLGDTSSVVTVYGNIGYNYRDINDSTTAYKFHQKGILYVEKSRRYHDIILAHEKMANTARHFKNRNKEMIHNRLAISYAKVQGDWVKAASLANVIGDALTDMKQFDQALEAYQEGMEFGKKGNNPAAEASNVWDFSYVSGENLGKRDQALAGYQRAFKLYLLAHDSVNAATMLSNVGQVLWKKKEFEKAIAAHQEAIEFSKLCKNFDQIAYSWSKLADLYRETNNPVASAVSLSESVLALEMLNDSTRISAGYFDLGRSYLSAKDYPKALEAFDRSLQIRKRQRDSLNWASTIYEMGSAYWSKTDYAPASVYLNQSLKLYRAIKDDPGTVYSLVSLGSLAQSADLDYKKAAMYIDEAISLAKKINDKNILAFAYLRKRGLARTQGKSKEADAYGLQALDLYTQLNQPKDIATTLINMGYDASYVYGDNEKAREYIHRAKAISDTIDDLSVQAYILETQALLAREEGDFKQALAYNEKTLAIFNEVKNEWSIAGAYIDKGNIYKQLNEYSLSIRYQQMADSIYQKIHAEYSRIAPYANIGDVFAAQGDYPKGLEYYQKAMDLMQKANDLNENLAIIQSLIGESHLFMNHFAEADLWLRKSLNVCDQVGAVRVKVDVLAMLGRLKIEEKKYEEAFRFLTEGLNVSKQRNLKLSYVSNLVMMGQLEVNRRNFASARPLLEECIKLSLEMGKNSSLWESLYWMGVLLKETNQLTQSRDFLKQAVDVLEKIRNKVSGGEEARKLFSSDKNVLKVYEALVGVLLQLGETDAALGYLQKNNEENLKAKFKSLDVRFENTDKKEILTRERDMKAKLDGIEDQISKEKALPGHQQNAEKLKGLQGTRTVAEGDYLKFVNQQVNVRPELSRYFNNSIQPAQLKGKKKQIPKDMALLSYLPGETQLYIFIATSDTVIAKVVNVTRDKINKNISMALNVIKTEMGDFESIQVRNEVSEREQVVTEQKQTDQALKPLEELFHYLIAPTQAQISSKKRLCIIPNGALSYFPFQLLGKTIANGKFSLLINQYSIFYANSTDMLLRVMEPHEKQFKIVAFGNPDKSLPSSEQEVSDIKKLFPSTTVFTREEATEDKAKYAGEEYNIMHFATHGSLDYEDFGKSYLTMAKNQAKNEDGLLTLEELWGMEVMNHLNIVVLSACQTAVSKGSDDSSPVSPASGFLQNGVKSVVATLWKVNDEATAVLMNEFYKNMKTMDAIDALRQAQVSVSSQPKYAHPYYWGAAVLLGDWR